MFTFEGIGIVLPLENKMKNPSDMRGWTGVLNTGMIFVGKLSIRETFNTTNHRFRSTSSNLSVF